MRLIDADALFQRAIEGKRFVFRLEELTTDMTAVFKTVYADLYDFIEQAPTINPADLVPKGRWEMRGGKRYCTHCGKKAGVTRDSEDFWYTVGTSFCPNCGARMDGDDHDAN